MKELSIEGNAYDGNYKTYTELINRLEDVKNAIKKQNYGIAMDILCKPYPEYQITTSTELKESDGLRIIKAIKYGLDHVFTNNTTVFEVTKEQCLAWLEKQGEHANFRNKIQIGDKVTRNEDGVLVNLSQLNRVAKKKGEQKPIVNDNAKEMFIKALERVEEQNAKGYRLTDCDKNSWWEDFKAYCGYTEIQKPAWSEEDEEIYRKCICAMRASACGFPEEEKFVEQVDNWFKSLKDRVQPKQEWSEEDRKIIIELIGIFESAIDGGHVTFPYRLIKDYIRVLKSCLPQNTWKPCDEQMDALNYVVNLMASSERPTENDLYYNILKSLRQQLKKLREK